MVEQLTARAEDYEIKVQAAMEARAKKQVSTEHLAKERGALADLEANEQRTASRISALLAAANGDLEQARRLWLSWRDLVLRTDKISEALRNIFATQEVDSLEALEGKSDDAALRRKRNIKNGKVNYHIRFTRDG